MNYKLVNHKFRRIEEPQGFIENNSGDTLELVILENGIEPVLNAPTNTYIKEHEKYSYTLNPTDVLYAKLVSRLVGEINVFAGQIGGEAGGGAISEVTATVDSGVGIPSVEVIMGGTPENRTLRFNFRNLKGERGFRGDRGDVGQSAFNAQGQIEYPNGTKEWIE